MFDFIEVFYNRQRRHSTLEFRTPVGYEHNAHHQHPPHSHRVHDSESIRSALEGGRAALLLERAERLYHQFVADDGIAGPTAAR